MAFTGAATTVIAQTFILQDPNGVIVGQLGPSTQFIKGNALIMNHNDVLTTDSSIAWTQPGSYGAGLEQLWIQGPEKVGGVGIGPSLTFSVGNVAGLPKSIEFLSSNVWTVNVNDNVTNLDVAGIEITSTTRAIAVKANSIPVVDEGGLTRGTIYGLRFVDTYLGAGVTLPAGITNLMAVVLPNMPVGGVLVFDFSAYMTQLLGGNVATLQILIDGVAAGPRAIWALGPQGQISNGFSAVVAAGAHTVTLQANELGVANSDRVQGGDTIMRVKMYA